MENYQLYEGVCLHTEKETRFKSEYFSINFIITGELLERAHASLLSSVLSAGCKKYPSEALLNRALDELYDAGLYVGGYTLGEAFVLSFSLSTYLDDYLPCGSCVRQNARDLLLDCILDPLTENDGFKKKIVANRKKNKLDALRAEKVDKARYAQRKAFELLCSGEPCAYSANDLKKDLRAVTPESLYAYYKKILSEAPIEIFYAGTQEGEELKDELTKRLSSLFSKKAKIFPDTKSPLKEKVARRKEKIPAHQSTLCLGYKTPILMTDSSYPALALMREMLCTSPLSLLFTEVREKESLCYYVSDRLLSRKGVYMLVSGIDGQMAGKTEKEIDRQIGRIANGEFDNELLCSCKRMMKNALSAIGDSPQNIEGWYIQQYLSGAERSPSEEAKRIDALTREDVMLAAASLQKDSVFLLEGEKRNNETKKGHPYA